MAPPRKFPPVEERLRLSLAQSRELGLSFDDAWTRAIPPGRLTMANEPDPPAGVVRWPSDGKDRRVLQAVVAATRWGWRRAYERCEPTEGEQALRALGAVLSELGSDEPLVSGGAAVWRRSSRSERRWVWGFTGPPSSYDQGCGDA